MILIDHFLTKHGNCFRHVPSFIGPPQGVKTVNTLTIGGMHGTATCVIHESTAMEPDTRIGVWDVRTSCFAFSRMSRRNVSTPSIVSGVLRLCTHLSVKMFEIVPLCMIAETVQIACFVSISETNNTASGTNSIRKWTTKSKLKNGISRHILVTTMPKKSLPR